MNYDEIFAKLKTEWKIKLSEDEWYLSNFNESFVSQLESFECIDAINFLINYILSETDIQYLDELADLFLLLARKANTTELPEELKKNKEKIELQFSQNDYQKNIWVVIKRIFLLDVKEI